MEEEETPMESGLLKVLTNGCTMHACMGGMMPIDVVRFLAICREVHGLVSVEDILVASLQFRDGTVLVGACLHGALFGSNVWRQLHQEVGTLVCGRMLR